VRYQQPKRDITRFTLQPVPEFLARLAAYRGRVMTRIAVELSLLTFVRSSELRFARWDEFDFDKSLWRIPAKREEIKGCVTHTVA
jgi:integrase